MNAAPRLVLALVLFAPHASAQNHKLNAPLARELRGRLVLPQTSADGRNHLYTADRDGDGGAEVYVVPTDGKESPRRLVERADAETAAFFAPDGKHVLYSADVDADGSRDLVAIPIDGSAAPRRLSAPLPGAEASVQIQGVDLFRVLYRAGPDLYSVTADGGTAPVRLNGALVPGGSLHFGAHLAHDGLTTLYAADQDPDPGFELYVVPTDGSQPAHRLPIPLVAGGAVIDFAFALDGAHVFYVADQDEDERYELFSIASDGSAPPRRVNAPLVPGGDVGLSYEESFYPGGFLLTLDGRWLLYSADQDEDERFVLYSVPTDGSRAPIALSTALSFSLGFYASYDSAWALYYTDPDDSDDYQAVSVPIDGSAPARVLTGPMVPGGHLFYEQLSPDSRTLVYAADQDVNGRYELYSAPIDGHAPAVKLNAPFPPGGELSVDERNLLPGFYVIDGGVLYAGDQTIAGVEELDFVPADGSASPRRLATGPFEDWFPSFTSSDFAYDHSYIALADSGNALLLRDTQLESVAVHDPAARPIVLDRLQPGAVAVDVEAFELSAGGDHVVYRAQEESDLAAELYFVRTDKMPGKVELLPYLPGGARVFEQHLTPDGSRVLYQAALTPGSGPIQLLAVPTAGGSPTVLSGASYTRIGFELTPDGQRVLYSSGSGLVLFVAPVDGSAAPIQLVSVASRITAQRTSADSSRVALLLESGRLLVAPLDGSAAAARPTAAGHRAQPDFRLTPDGTRVVYRTDPQGRAEVFLAPSDASSPPVRISDPMPVTGDVLSLELAPDGSRVVYLANLAGRMELFTVPLEGGAPPVRLHAPLDEVRDVLDFRISADSRHVVFRGDLVVDERFELFSVPIDASLAPVRVNGALLPSGDVFDFELSPDGRRVVYRARQSASDVLALTSAPIRGGRGTVRLSRALVPGGDVATFRISADSSTVAFTAARDAAGALTLLAAPITGAVKAQELAGPFTGAGSVASFALSADGSVAAYTADQETPGVTEVLAAATHLRPVVVRR
jgi:Tol biopolymer transport system component